MSTLHVHLDESGNFTFGPQGSTYFIFAVAWTYQPAGLAADLTSLRYDLLKQGYNLQRFHATTDRQAHRNAVVERLLAHDDWRFAGLVVEKSKVHPPLRPERKFYPRFATMLLRFVLRGCMRPGTSNVLVYTDTLPIGQKREAVEKAIKIACKAELGGTPFHSYHHKSESNTWIQVADYCGWALSRKWERGDIRTYNNLLRLLEAPELDVLSLGSTRYY